MNAILYDKIQIAKAVNVQVISLDDAPKGYLDFDKGAAAKYVIDPHGVTGQREDARHAQNREAGRLSVRRAVAACGVASRGRRWVK